MSGGTHTGIPRRILAAIVAIGLTGVPALAVEQLSAGHDRPHRCQCPRGEHDCECALCRRAARRARRARVADLPACHRAAALEALAHEEAEERRAPPAGACVRSACNPADDLAPGAAGRELVVLPGAAAPPSPGFVTRLPARAERPVSRALEPELPPPRRA